MPMGPKHEHTLRHRFDRRFYGQWCYPVRMHPGASNEKKRHHYIPITYLDKFADNLGKVFAYRKDDVQRPLHVRPSEIAFERYYYSQPLLEGGRDNNTLEDFFSTIENTWSLLAARLRAGSAGTNDFTGSDFECLFTFLCLMRVRVPATRDMVEVSRAEQVKATARILDQEGMLPPRPKGHEDILDHMTVAIDPHQSLLAMGDLARGFSIVLDHLGFEVLHNKTDVSFLTSDNPVVCFDPTVPEERVLPYQVRPPHGAIELLFPVDADTILRGRTGLRRSGPQRLRHSAMTECRQAKRINRFVARFGYRFVFSRDRAHEALITKHAAKSPVVETVTVPGPTGGTLVLHECVFGPRPAKPRWNA